MKKYNPDLHKNIPSNLRYDAKRENLDTSYLSDEELYNIYCYWYGIDEPEKEIMKDIKSKIKR